MNRFKTMLFALTLTMISLSAVCTAALGQTASSSALKPMPAPESSVETAATMAESVTVADPASLIPDLPALPSAKTTLVGGTIQKVNRVQDRVTLQVFGGGKTTVFFDGRTNVYRDGEPSSLASLRPGERVYLDTVLYQDMVFARNIRLRTGRAEGESQGIVVSYRPERSELVVRDVTAPQPLKLRVTPSTRVTKDGRDLSARSLAEGTLVAIKFGSEGGGRGIAQQISILAEPGAPFTFTGTVKFLDLHAGLVVLRSSTDGKTYEVYLAPSVSTDQSLREGAQVTALTQFKGNRYVAHTLTIAPNSNP